MAGEANDAVSANTQVKMKDAPRLLKLPETKCVTIRKKAPLLSSSRQMGEDRCSSDSFCLHFVRRPIAGLLRERNLEDFRL